MVPSPESTNTNAADNSRPSLRLNVSPPSLAHSVSLAHAPPKASLTPPSIRSYRIDLVRKPAQIPRTSSSKRGGLFGSFSDPRCTSTPIVIYRTPSGTVPALYAPRSSITVSSFGRLPFSLNGHPRYSIVKDCMPSGLSCASRYSL